MMMMMMMMTILHLPGTSRAHEAGSTIDSHAEVVSSSGGGVGADFGHLAFIDADLCAEALEQKLAILAKLRASLWQRF